MVEAGEHEEGQPALALASASALASGEAHRSSYQVPYMERHMVALASCTVVASVVASGLVFTGSGECWLMSEGERGKAILVECEGNTYHASFGAGILVVVGRLDSPHRNVL